MSLHKLVQLTYYGRPMKPFFIEIPNFWQANWADEFLGIWGIFGQFNSTHFDTLSPLFIFSNYQLLLQKTKPLYPNPKYLVGIGIIIRNWAAKNEGFIHRVSVVRA